MCPHTYHVYPDGMAPGPHERTKATTEWLKPLAERLAQADGPAPWSVRLAAALSVLLTPLLAYLTIGFTADVLEFAARPGMLPFIQILLYGMLAVGTGALTVACPLGAVRLLRDGDPTYIERIGFLIGGVLAAILALSLASFGRLDGTLFGQLGPAALCGFGLSWLVRSHRSAGWLQSRRARRAGIAA